MDDPHDCCCHEKDAYRGQLQIYCHPDLTETISTLCRLTLQGKFYNMIGERIFLVPVEDGETVHILDYDVTFLIFSLPRQSN